MFVNVVICLPQVMLKQREKIVDMIKALKAQGKSTEDAEKLLESVDKMMGTLFKGERVTDVICWRRVVTHRSQSDGRAVIVMMTRLMSQSKITADSLISI